MRATLRVGDSSARVAEARTTLARLGMLPEYEGSLDDWNSRKFSKQEMLFDEALADTIKAFQQSRGIMPTGNIDDITLRELRQASYKLGNRVLNYQPGQELSLIHI